MSDVDEHPTLTIDELARECGLPTSTIRMYQHRGLLPAPERRGRVGHYGPTHRERLRLIEHLQGRGHSLAAIKDLLDSWEAGRSIGAVLGVSDLAPGLVPSPVRLSPEEVAERFAGLELTQTDLSRAATLGMVELDGSDVVVTNAAFVDIGPAVMGLGIPVEVILDEYEALQPMLDTIAARFRDVFDRHLWERFEAEGLPPEQVPALSSQVAALTELATSVVTIELRRRFAEFAADYVARADAAPRGDRSDEPSSEITFP